MHLYTTDFDRHLDMLEHASGDVHFYSTETNHRRFVNTVVKAARQLQPPEKLLIIFNESVAHSKKAHHVMRAIGERIEDIGIADRTTRCAIHAFVVPPNLFKMLKAATAENLSEADVEALLETL